MKTNIKKILNLVGNIGVIICLVFLFKSIIKQDIDWLMYLDNPINITVFVLCIILIVIGVYLTAYTYKRILDGVCDTKTSQYEINKMYVTANIGKYLPGNVMHFVGRNLLSVKYNIPQNKILLSTVLELMMIGISCVVWIIIGGRKYIEYLIQTLFKNRTLVIVGGIGIGIVILTIVVLFYIKREWLMQTLSIFKFKHLIRAQIYHVLIFALSSITYCIVVYVITPNCSIGVLRVAFIAYMIAWLIGFITPGAPGGIGVKEIILGYFLGGVLGNQILLVSVIIHRVLSVIGDFMAYLILRFNDSIKR